MRCGFCSAPIERVDYVLGWSWRHVDRDRDHDHRPVTGDYGTPDPPVDYPDSEGTA